MTMPTHIVDHADRALALLPGQFVSSLTLRGLIAMIVGITHAETEEEWNDFILAWLDSGGTISCDEAPAGTPLAIQEVEDVLWDVMVTQWLSVAEGAQLDLIGVYVGLGRTSTTDSEYRYSLYTQIAILSSQGDPERLITVAKRVSGASLVHYQQAQPAIAVLYCHALTRIAELLRVQEAATGGVRVMVIGSADSDVFVFGADMDGAGVEHGSALPYGLGYAEFYAGSEEIIGGGSFAEWFKE